MQQAEVYKAQGNAALLSGQFAEAVELYTKAIALEPNSEIYFSNRAAAYAGLERWREALDDSHEVVTLKPDWVKGWVRRGAAFTGLGKHEEARKAYAKAVQLEPGNAQVREKMEAAEKAAEAAKGKKEKNWEDDLWSDDEDGADGADASTQAAATAPAAASGAKRPAPPTGLDGNGDGIGSKRCRTKPGPALLAQLDRSLKDASEDTLRACLAQIASADEDICERSLRMLENLNAASSEGSAAEDEEEEGGQGLAAWLRGDNRAKGTAARRRRDSDSD